MTNLGVDYSYSQPRPALVAANGYTFVCRYLSSKPGSGKVITKTEAQQLDAAGLCIVLVFELTADRTKAGFDAGTADATYAKQAAHDVGAPDGCLIYFAVDFDAAATDLPAIDDYFRGAQSVLGAQRVGGYGKASVGRRLLDNNRAAKWWQSYA